ncbi:IS481 family transposase [Catellatospora bangladeshensis]|uniref:IS481 family transposase n=1 Tax=Catellatospora bangladeshensis TaxID=310355 RepID=UPI0036155B02
MSTRLAMITAAEMPGVTVTDLCAQLGISRKTFYEMRKRFDKEGPAGLEPRSRRPLYSPTQIPAAVEQRIVRLREQLPLDNGAQAIFYHLQRDGIEPLPSPRTVHRVLVRNGLVTPQPAKRPHASWHRFEYDAPNACWQIDATRWQLRSGRTVWIMDILDDHSRYLAAADAVPADTTTAAWNAFCHAATECGPPAKVLSDNGLCFTGGLHAPGAFERNLAALGITKANSRPYHPQTCGKLERAHQTLKKWLRPRPAARSLPDLQRQLDDFRAYYNHHRPRRALHGATPAERFHATTPARPAGTPIDLPQPPTLTITDRTTTSQGVINASKAVINVGTTRAGHTLTVITYGERVAILDGTTLVRVLTLEPGRRYYPLLSPMS